MPVEDEITISTQFSTLKEQKLTEKFGSCSLDYQIEQINVKVKRVIGR